MSTYTITVNDKQLVYLQDAIGLAIDNAQFDGDDYLVDALGTLSNEADKAWTNPRKSGHEAVSDFVEAVSDHPDSNVV